MIQSLEPSTPEWLAAGFAEQVVQWARQHCDALPADALKRVWLAAHRLSLATSAGHVCLPLHDLLSASRDAAAPERTDSNPPALTLGSLRQSLMDSGTVGTPLDPGACPMVLDDHDRLYLHRYFNYECRLAARLLRAAVPSGDLLNEHDRLQTRQLLHSLLPADDHPHASEAPDGQHVAVALALTRRLTIISGGPGTGKTTTVVSLLACLLAQHPDARIALAAPTGKAAARMTEAIRSRAGHLPHALQARMPTSSSTVHRLLGVRPEGAGFVHHANHRLPIDVLIVDEASMLDLALATHLLEAVPEHARIVLLGDKDQLASVEAGAVFAELSRESISADQSRATLHALLGPAPSASQSELPEHTQSNPQWDVSSSPGALNASVVWLNRTYRFNTGSGIGQLAHAVREGSPEALLAAVRRAPSPSSAQADITWISDTASPGATHLWTTLVEGYAPLALALAQAPHDVAAVTHAFNQFRALCAVREGPYGSRSLNQRLSDWIRQQVGAPPASAWFIGQALIVRQNDYLLGLFNGDVGLVLPNQEGELCVWFSQDPQGYRSIAPARLPAHEPAYALTIHTSQGSEFDRVAVILPPLPARTASRELLYTGITRARHSLVLSASEAALSAAVLSPTRRDSGLLDRLSEVAQPGLVPSHNGAAMH